MFRDTKSLVDWLTRLSADIMRILAKSGAIVQKHRERTFCEVLTILGRTDLLNQFLKDQFLKLS